MSCKREKEEKRRERKRRLRNGCHTIDYRQLPGATHPWRQGRGGRQATSVGFNFLLCPSLDNSSCQETESLDLTHGNVRSRRPLGAGRGWIGLARGVSGVVSFHLKPPMSGDAHGVQKMLHTMPPVLARANKTTGVVSRMATLARRGTGRVRRRRICGRLVVVLL